MDVLSTEHLFRPLQLARAGANTQALEEGDVELGVDATVAIPACLGDAPLTFQYSEVLRRNTESP